MPNIKVIETRRRQARCREKRCKLPFAYRFINSKFILIRPDAATFNPFFVVESQTRHEGRIETARIVNIFAPLFAFARIKWNAKQHFCARRFELSLSPHKIAFQSRFVPLNGKQLRLRKSIDLLTRKRAKGENYFVLCWLARSWRSRWVEEQKQLLRNSNGFERRKEKRIEIWWRKSLEKRHKREFSSIASMSSEARSWSGFGQRRKNTLSCLFSLLFVIWIRFMFH